MINKNVFSSIATAGALLMLLSGCGQAVDSDTAATTASPTAAAQTTAAAATEAVSEAATQAANDPAGVYYVDQNCGIETEYTKVPERVVTLTSNATETMLELGLQDHMVGTAYMRGRDIAPAYTDTYNTIEVLSDEQPTMEQVLAVNPDFVYSGYPDGFSPKNGHTREQLGELDIKTHLNPEGCTTSPVSVDDIFTEMNTIGKIFQVEDKANDSIAKLRERLDAVKEKLGSTEPVKVFLYASGDDKANTTGGYSMATALIAAAGGENIFADTEERWMPVSWEQVAERNPDIILVREEGTTPQYQSPSVEAKIETLKSIPAIADTNAMKNEKFATLTLSQLQPGPFSVDGVEHMAKQFHPEQFGE